MKTSSRSKLPAAIRHYWMLVLAAGLGIALAREGSVLPVEARENENPQEVAVSSDLVVDAEDSKNHTPLHRPTPDVDVDGPGRVNIDQLTDFSKFELPKLEP
jgi:hypothetical protein